ncbi:hypothetical protein Bamb_4234 [Burkholderia ambifaria AMMD]|uniref:Uncharacterized protein n=1 Tax=Burkholderia ambifaria (strain ATCC BAA-244 / DSM 16087 / CCUG 44356 / LMG 19182 / AMMD) TaxID=339670 RepID=Q0B7T6_BURCM|nr:hypothetical protein Bamb_4234 [Burkholderia ambifaria AMMD]
MWPWHTRAERPACACRDALGASVEQRLEVVQQPGEHPRTGVEGQHRVVVRTGLHDLREIRQQKAEVHGLAPGGDGMRAGRVVGAGPVRSLNDVSG